MQPFTFLQQCELQKPLTVTQLSGVVFTADVMAATFMVDVLDGGEAVSLTGATVTGYAIRADGATVTLAGSASGNRASITLDASCYVIQGTLDVVIKVTSGGATVTVGAWRAYVQRSTTDAIVDPGHVIPSIEELLAQIGACETATTAANTAAGSANTAASAANTAASSANAAAQSLENMDAIADTLETGQPATVSVATIGGHYRLMLGLPKGDTGAAATIDDTKIRYVASQNGTTPPGGSAEWQGTPPTVPQGCFLWTRCRMTWSDNTQTTIYSVARQGVDGLGSVSSVDNVSPDANGNVTLPKDSTPTQSSTNLITSGAVYAADAAQDAAIGALRADVAIVEDGTTASRAISAGQYVVWQGSLYTANSVIASGTTLSAASGGNLEAVPDGGLNALNDKIAWKLLYYANGTMTNAINLDLAKYPMLLFENKYGESFIICQQADANGSYPASVSRFYDASVPLVVFQYALKINSDATGIYIDSANSRQVNINSDGTVTVIAYSSSEFDFVRIYGAQVQ